MLRRILDPKGCVLWLTGMADSGKSTLALALKERLWRRYGVPATIVDSDDFRRDMNAHLGHTQEDRVANVANLARVANAAREAGGFVILCCQAPTSVQKQMLFDIIGGEWITSVFLDCPVSVLQLRDTKGLYAKHAAGELPNLAGMDMPFEPPTAAFCVENGSRPPMVIDTKHDTVRSCTYNILRKWDSRTYALLVGRWGPLHKGHQHVIDEALKDHDYVAVAVRITDEPVDVGTRIECLEAVYGDNSRVAIFPIHDISAIRMGRRVGYEVVRYETPDNFAAISGTEIRTLMAAGDPTWHDLVDERVVKVLEQRMKQDA